MRSMRARSTVVVCAAVLVALTGCSGNSESDKTSASSSTASASSKPTYDDDHIMAEVAKTNTAFRGHDPNALIPKDADWATDEFRGLYNADTKELKDMGVVQKGTVTTKALHLAKSDPDAPGGWSVTVYNCKVSTIRLHIDGEDVTMDPHDADKPLPKGPRNGVSLDRYTTPDAGKTWQVDDSQLLSPKDAKASPCAP